MRAIALIAVLSACHVGSQTSADAGAGGGIDVGAYPLRMNPGFKDGTVIVMGGDEGCHNIAADVAVEGLMAAINKSEPTSCESLADPAWQTCRFGEVYAKADKSECVCRVAGREPKAMSCPE